MKIHDGLLVVVGLRGLASTDFFWGCCSFLYSWSRKCGSMTNSVLYGCFCSILDLEYWYWLGSSLQIVLPWITTLYLVLESMELCISKRIYFLSFKQILWHFGHPLLLELVAILWDGFSRCKKLLPWCILQYRPNRKTCNFRFRL